MRLIRVATLSIGFAFAFAAVALGQRGNWFDPIGASPKLSVRGYDMTPAQLNSGKPSSIMTAFAAVSFPAGLRAQSETPRAKNTMNESLDAWNARFEARETQPGKSTVPESQAMLKPEILQAPEQASVKPLSMPKISTARQRADRQSWISVGPESLPLATT